MNSCCLQYYIIPEKETTNIKKLEEESSECDDCVCHCGYIQYESLVPHMPRLTNNYTKDEEHILLEAKLRQQIIEISRLFDEVTKAQPGTYSKAHYKVIKIHGNGTDYLPVPEFVKGTLEVYTENGYLINPSTYIYKDGFLKINPCSCHSSSCGCSTACGNYTRRDSKKSGWCGLFQVKAKFGKQCADQAVQIAIRDFLIEHNTFADEKEVRFGGLVARPFRVPYTWSILVEKYLQTKKLDCYFGFA